MKRHVIGFDELLRRLLPLEQLPPGDRARIEQALREGSPQEVESEALAALHQLEQADAVRSLAPEPGSPPGTLRFQLPGTLDLITLEMPPTIRREGIEIHPRVALLPRARTGMEQVRRLMRLDDPLVFSDPRRGNARLGLIELLDETGRELIGASAVRFVPRAPEGGGDETPPFDRALALQARSDERVVISCCDTLVAPALQPEGARRGVRALALAGVFSENGEPLGHLEALSPEPQAFGPDELAMLALLADCCAFAWERSSRIEQLVFIDPMTAAFNRSYFDRQVLNEMARAARENASFALCIADIDNFKNFNTRYGYDAGNRVLEHVAHTLKSGVRPFDTVARWGGEEFAILLTAPIHDIDLEPVCERLRELVERQEVEVEGLDGRVERIAVTASMGVALYPTDASNPHDLFRAANQALLRAKLPPKNRVEYAHRPSDRQPFRR